MENATKALIIAAAVLIAIILIAVGLRILAPTQGTVKQVQTVSTTMEISMFNSQFEKFDGNRRGNEVKELLRFVRQNNTTSEHKITFSLSPANLQYSGQPEEYDDIMDAINISTIYTVRIMLDENTGYVAHIHVE